MNGPYVNHKSQSLRYKIVFALFVEYNRSEATFRYDVTGIKQFEGSQVSDIFMVRDLPW